MQIRIANIDELFEKSDKKIITNPEPINKKKMEFSEGGIYSPEIFGNLDCEFEIYTCECGKSELSGPYYKGFICPKCGTEIKESTASVQRTGWIELNTLIINPIMYSFVQRLIPNLDELINYTLTINSDGQQVYPENCIGMTKFIEKFDELILPNKEAKKDIYDFVVENRNNIFIDKMEVFSIILRPAQLQGTKINYDRINNTYSFILRKSLFIKNSSVPDELSYEIQKHALVVFDHVLELLKGKEGIIRGELLGTRMNFTARCVISPADTKLHFDTVVLPYIVALELYRYHIIAKLVEIKDVNYLEAFAIVDLARIQPNEEIIQIMKLIEETQETCGLINRNPTIALGSILFMNFKFKYDLHDLTMEISNIVLSLLAGDFDGDGTAE